MGTCLLCETHDSAGGYLCLGCTRATVVRLECLPDLYAGLQQFLAPSAAVAQGRSGTGGPAPLPVREETLDLRGPGGMVGVVEDHLSAVRQERGMGQLLPVGSVEARLKSAVSELLANMPWIAVSWPEAGTFAGEIRELTRSARSVIAPHDPVERGIRLGKCPAVDESGTICGAILTYRRGEQVVTCPWCTCSFPPATWAGLKEFIDHDARNAA
ncbi:hypothetical protein [Streptomyces brevispora]|uniref:Uncharacterized protein n=1 Tax=Streptomyces brevispora TaxID=887462 RepID=A0ABZ1G379_9ACTN|nr:hypothetical protein [Streptomyces brevispora]WSC14336.1 hypothetical protein OIE64_16800 [Streptomyces brevispora]